MFDPGKFIDETRIYQVEAGCSSFVNKLSRELNIHVGRKTDSLVAISNGCPCEVCSSYERPQVRCQPFPSLLPFT